MSHMSQKKSYLLAPNFDFPPDDAIVLGNLIADPQSPHRALARLTPDKQPRTRTTVKQDVTITRGTGDGVRCSQGVQLAELIGARIGIDVSRDNSAEFRMQSLRTDAFSEDPSDEAIKELLGVERVKHAMRSTIGTRPLFMISAVKIAQGLSFGRTKTAALSFDTGATGPVVAAVGVESEVGYRRERREEDSFRAEGDVVIAYQLLVIAQKGWRTKFLSLSEYQPKRGFLSDKKEGSSDKDDMDTRAVETEDLLTLLEMEDEDEYTLNEVHITADDQDKDEDLYVIVYESAD